MAIQRGRVASLVAADVAVLWLARLEPARLLLLVRHPDASLARLGADDLVALVARTALWLMAAWVALALLAVGGAQLPGVVGRSCRLVATTAVPAGLRRIVFGAVGLSIGIGLCAGPTTSAALASAPDAASHRPVACAPPVAHDLSSIDENLPAPPWPGSPPARHHPGHRTTSHHRPAAHRSPAPAGTGSADHARVRAGDSLWLIATRRLGPDATPSRTAAYWPQVYAANRSTVGADPDLISPGQLLRLPVPDRTNEGVQR